jgi:hypothetical protein
LEHHDSQGNNNFYIVRKGFHNEVDSYGLGLENDGKTKTEATKIFDIIGRKLSKLELKKVNIYIAGVATNYCVKFSIENIKDFLAYEIEKYNITTELNIITELCREIQE